MSTVEPMTATPASFAYPQPNTHDPTRQHSSATYGPTSSSSHITAPFYPIHGSRQEEPASMARRSQSTAGGLLLGAGDFNVAEATISHSDRAEFTNRAENASLGSQDSPMLRQSPVRLHGCPSLRRFNSLLRKVSTAGGAMTAGLVGFNPLLSFTPYTPPPILSPMRKGTGLFCHVKPSTSGGSSTKGNAGLWAQLFISRGRRFIRMARG